jgi:hypothetical protein
VKVSHVDKLKGCKTEVSQTVHSVSKIDLGGIMVHGRQQCAVASIETVGWRHRRGREPWTSMNKKSRVIECIRMTTNFDS